MNWKKTIIPLSIALAVGLFAGVPAWAHGPGRCAGRHHRSRVERRAPFFRDTCPEHGIRIHGLQPFPGAAREAGPRARQPRHAPGARPGTAPWGGAAKGKARMSRRGALEMRAERARRVRLRRTFLRLRAALLRNPALAQRLERWLENLDTARAAGEQKGKPRRFKKGKAKKSSKGKARGKGVPPPGKGKNKHKGKLST